MSYEYTGIEGGSGGGDILATEGECREGEKEIKGQGKETKGGVNWKRASGPEETGEAGRSHTLMKRVLPLPLWMNPSAFISGVLSSHVMLFHLFSSLHLSPPHPTVPPLQ